MFSIHSKVQSKRLALFSLALLTFAAAPVAAQQILLADEVLSEDFQSFRGAGLDPGGTAGRLDSNHWRIRVSPAIETDFGQTTTEVELARGVNAGTIGTGGLWAFTVGPDDYALGAQPTGSLFTDGHFETHVTNGTGGPLSSIDIAFDFCSFNKRDRSQFFRGQLRHPSTEGGMITHFFYQGATPGIQDPAPVDWVCERVEVSVDLSASPLQPDARAEITWFTNDSEGETATGTRDALALNNVLIATTRCGNGIVSSGAVCDDGNAVTETECPYGVPTCSACNADCSAELDLTGPFCGDGIVQAEHGEACDPAEVGGPACTAECELVPDQGDPDVGPDAGADDVGHVDAGDGDAGHDGDVGHDAGQDTGTFDDVGQADVGASDDAGTTGDTGSVGVDTGNTPGTDDAGDDAGLAGDADEMPAPRERADRDGGCGCASVTQPSPHVPGLAVLAILGLVALIRRRRAAR